MVEAMAMYLGLSHESSIGNIRGVIEDIVHNFALKVTHRTNEEWSSASSIFSLALHESTPATIRRKELQPAQLAFLGGVAYGLRTDQERHKPQNVRRMPLTAKRVGLGCPINILAEQLDTSKASLLSLEEQL